MSTSTLIKSFLIIDLLFCIPAYSSVTQSQLDRIVGTLNISAKDVVIIPDTKINAHTDGNKIYINQGILDVKEITQEEITLVLLHENAHRDLEHPKKLGTIKAVMNSIFKPLNIEDEMVGFFKETVNLLFKGFIRNNELEADTQAFKKAYELGLPETVCDLNIKLLGDDTSLGELGDFDHTHPLNFKRTRKCHSIYTQLRGELKNG